MNLPRARRTLLAVLCAVAVGSLYAAQPILAPMGHELGIPARDLGWIIAAGQLGYLVGLVALVPLGDVLDRRKLMAAHLALAAAGVALAALATTPWVLFAGLALAGLFAVVVQTAVAYTAAASDPAARGRNLGVVTSGVVIGILGARVASGALAQAWGWRSVYALLAMLLLALAVLVMRALPPDPRTRRTPYGQVLASCGGLFRSRLFLSRGLITFFVFASFGTLWSGIALPLMDAPWRLSPAEIGLLGVAGLVGALGAAGDGRWADLGLASRVSGAALLLLLASWAAVAQTGWSLWLLVIGVIVLDFAVQAVHVSNQHTLTTAHPSRTSSVIGGYMAFYSLGSSLGAAATTFAFDAFAWTGSSLLGAAFAACAFTIWVLSRRSTPPGQGARNAP